jgi:hypothetical protein
MLFNLLLLALALILATGCATARQGERVRLSDLPMAPLENMPDYVRDAEPRIQEAYQFAKANPEALEHIPCYCGCSSLGHKNNLECYIAPSGDYDQHAAFCGVCIDITQDVMQMTREGKALAEMRTFIDTKYSKYGPGTDTDPVPHAGMPDMAGPSAAEPAPVENDTACGVSEETTSCAVEPE